MTATSSTAGTASVEPLTVARNLAGDPGLCFLDAATGAGLSRVFWDPAAVFTAKGSTSRLTWRDGESIPGEGDPFRALAGALRTRPDLTAAGYWGYDLRYHLERLPRRTLDDLHLPDCWVGLYEPSRVLVGPGTPRYPSSNGEDYPDGQAAGGPPAAPPGRGCRESVSRAEYEAAVRRIQEYIAAGDCYQVNLSRRIDVPLSVPPWEIYERLRRASPAPFAAYLNCGDHQVLSSSPELFLRVSGRDAATRPIKGTRPRGRSPEEDCALGEELIRSEKDRAELLMIVDLERNDLGRACEYGTVRVPELFRLESYANVHHLVATVCGRLRQDVGPLEALRTLFPGGSITGAPKIRAMEIIEELEPVRRGVYTGAIGWVNGAGEGQWNIAIRTMVAKGGRAYLHVGGAVVADSDPGAEYEETVTKAQGMLRALDMV